jgi:hypothetical protein
MLSRPRARAAVAHQLAERRSFSRSIVKHIWLQAQLPRVAGRSTVAEAVRYALTRWDGLTRLLRDGRIELDTNPVERAIRPVALSRKNHLLRAVTAPQGGRSPDAAWYECSLSQLGSLLARKGELDAPAEHLMTMRRRRQASATLMPGCSDSKTTASFSSSAKLLRFERPSCGGSGSRAAVKSFSREQCSAALLAPVLVCG